VIALPRPLFTALKLAALAAVVAILAVLPRFMGEFRVGQFTFVGIYFIALLGLNILTGYSGQISLGHGAFMGIGAYVTAVLTLGRKGLVLFGHHPPHWLPLGDGMRPALTIPIALVVTGIVGFLFGMPALRLAGVSLALATFAVAVSLPTVAKRFCTSRRRTGSTTRPGAAPRSSSSSPGSSCAHASDAPGARSATGSLLRPLRASARRSTRRSRSAFRPHSRGSRARCLRFRSLS